MSDGIGGYNNGNLTAQLSKHIGETVTIFTSSGGESGSGFTGVILSVNECFVRLLTRIGPPPGCALGNACSWNGTGYENYGCKGGYGAGGGYGTGAGYGSNPVLPANLNGALTAGGWNGFPVSTVGSVTDIPISNIVAFAHNAV